MAKRLTLKMLAVLLGFGIAGCGGGGSNAPTPLPTPTPPTQAAVTFNVDPNPVVANSAPNGWYRFRVNLAFSESAGIGYTIDTIHLRVFATSTGEVAVNGLEPVDVHIPAFGREVLQLDSGPYQAQGGGRVGLTCDFIANITDDRGNALTASNQVTVTRHGGPAGEIPRE